MWLMRAMEASRWSCLAISPDRSLTSSISLATVLVSVLLPLPLLDEPADDVPAG
jgi:hypothetical protein